jgi:hypothetical protein
LEDVPGVDAAEDAAAGALELFCWKTPPAVEDGACVVAGGATCVASVVGVPPELPAALHEAIVPTIAHPLAQVSNATHPVV